MAESDLHAVAFPRLSEAQVAALGRCSQTKLRRFHAGEKLFAACDRDPRFFVVKAGEVEIVDDTGAVLSRFVISGVPTPTGPILRTTAYTLLVHNAAGTTTSRTVIVEPTVP